jgi:hypothetical protein
MPGRTTCCGTTARGLRLLPTPGKGRFALPVQQPRSTGLGRSSGDYHSFTYGPLHIVALPERYIDLTAGSYFQRWLDADLRQAAADPTIKWRITFGHRPFFSTGRPASRRGSFVRRVGPAGTGEISRRHRVQRHEHVYERTPPMLGGTLRRKNSARWTQGIGTAYVVTRGGGAPIYDDFGPAQPWDAVRRKRHEHVRVDLDEHGRTLRLTAIADDHGDVPFDQSSLWRVLVSGHVSARTASHRPCTTRPEVNSRRQFW